jgi:hypothetical protein
MKRVHALLCAALALLASAPARAQIPSEAIGPELRPEEMTSVEKEKLPWSRWDIAAGGFIASTNANVRIGLPGVGVDINLDEALGIKTSDSVFRVDAGFRFGSTQRHRIDFTWFDLTQSGSKTLDQDITVGDTTFPAGTAANSEYTLAFYNVRYSYSFILDERVDFALSAGLHITDVGLSVEAAGLGTAGDSVTAPLPVVGGRLDVALTPRWFLRTSLEALYVEFSNFRGLLTDMILATEYRIWDHFALGLGLNAVRMGLEVEDQSAGLDFNGSVTSTFVGLMIYGKLSF